METPTVEHMKHMLTKAGLCPLRSQAALSTRILRQRLQTVLPEAMGASGMDMWIVAAREYNEDPVMKTLFAWDMPTARRITMLVFYRDPASGHVRAMSAGTLSPEMSGLYENALVDKESVWDCLGRIVRDLDPRTIAVNRSVHSGFCDGLSSTLLESIRDCLPPGFGERLRDGEPLSVRWLQKATALEQELMQVLVGVTQDIIRMCFSRESIVPGKTTTTDIEWQMRDTIHALGFDNWFGPDVDLQRKGGGASRMFDQVIQPGDLLHCDIGLAGRYVRLHTDIQWLAYVRRPGESQAPAGLVSLMKKGNRFQDIVAGHFRQGHTGNQIFEASIRQAEQEGLVPMLYTHPLGTFGHGAGPNIGVYGSQGFVAGTGERQLTDNTCYALELNVRGPVAEWDDQEVFVYLEEDICFGSDVRYLHGRETELIVL